MRISLVALALTSLVGSAIAQTQIPIPAFSRTFSSSGLTRGFYFQAPIPFVISGVRVPDETMNGTQNVEIIITNAAPPAYPATVTGTQAFYAANMPSSQILPASVVVQPGDWVSILGACGTSTMANSYSAPGPHPSTIFGAPVTLDRVLTQTNINITGGNSAISIEANGAIGRVEVYLQAGMNVALATTYGTGCGATGVSPMTLVGDNRPIIGTTTSATLTEIPATFIAGSFILGLSNPGVSLDSLGLTGCTLYSSGELVAIPYTPSMGSASFSIPIPAGIMPGGHIYVQAAAIAPSVNAFGAALSNGLDWTLGTN